jgi:hypothetical protein
MIKTLRLYQLPIRRENMKSDWLILKRYWSFLVHSKISVMKSIRLSILILIFIWVNDYEMKIIFLLGERNELIASSQFF